MGRRNFWAAFYSSDEGIWQQAWTYFEAKEIRYLSPYHLDHCDVIKMPTQLRIRLRALWVTFKICICDSCNKGLYEFPFQFICHSTVHFKCAFVLCFHFHTFLWLTVGIVLRCSLDPVSGWRYIDPKYIMDHFYGLCDIYEQIPDTWIWHGTCVLLHVFSVLRDCCVLILKLALCTWDP